MTGQDGVVPMSDEEISLQFATYAEKKLDWPRRDSIVRRSVNAFVAIGYALLGIHVELRRLNDGRDQFHREVLDLLSKAMERKPCGSEHRLGQPVVGDAHVFKCELELGHGGRHTDSRGNEWKS